ncbi:hypothetical protein A8F94_16660 [Bacillus sp. FJAT-27225]|nr:hypothetical protein A8F94_16660 [Bacillus sp. FJAT-27225]
MSTNKGFVDNSSSEVAEMSTNQAFVDKSGVGDQRNVHEAGFGLVKQYFFTAKRADLRLLSLRL